jgi:DNA-directed RNA polymerase subunit RPC12/RpoP
MPRMVCACGNVVEFQGEGTVQCAKCNLKWEIKRRSEKIFFARRVEK